jgi:hypothetical protein
VKLKGSGDYGKLRGIDPDEADVHDLKVLWLNDQKRDDVPSLLRLSLVRRGSGVPDESEEAQASVLGPQLKLRAAGVADGSALLVDFAGGSLAPGARRVTHA